MDEEKPDTVTAYFSSGMDLEMPRECMLDCSAQGDATEAVEFWEPRIDWSDWTPQAVADELSEYGCWDDLGEDPDEDRQRLLWIAAGSAREEEA